MEEKDIWLNKKNGWAFLIVIALCLLIGLLKDVMGKPKPTKKILEIKVRKNWCLSEIALNLGTDWLEIARLNNFPDPNKIYPGQKLKVIPFNKKNTVKVSWYGRDFHGKLMTNKKPFNMYDPTIAAQKWLPMGMPVRLTRVDTRESIVVVVQDRGPYKKKKNRSFDISFAAAKLLNMVEKGEAECKVEILR